VPTTTDVARRPGAAPAAAQPGAALELRAGQTMWTQNQHAALVAMGIPKTASSAELGVFLHQCQRTGLDPFSRQIYLIYRPSFEDGKNIMKPTTQVGIDGFRVIRDRIAKREGYRVEYEDTIWYGSDGQPCDVWLWDEEKPAACKVTVVVDGRRFPAVLRFAEYAQKKKSGELNKMWTEKPAHMIEKCAEADALRKAFPNDMAGVILEDAAPLDDPDAPAERPRVTSEQARQRGQQRQQPKPAQADAVDAVVVDEAPWPADAAPAAEPDSDVRNGILAQLARLGVTSTPGAADYITQLTGHAGLEQLPRKDADTLLAMLAGCESRADLDALLADGTVPGGE